MTKKIQHYIASSSLQTFKEMMDNHLENGWTMVIQSETHSVMTGYNLHTCVVEKEVPICKD